MAKKKPTKKVKASRRKTANGAATKKLKRIQFKPGATAKEIAAGLRAHEKARKANAGVGDRVPIFVVKPGDVSIEELAAVVQKAVDEYLATKAARRKRKRR